MSRKVVTSLYKHFNSYFCFVVFLNRQIILIIACIWFARLFDFWCLYAYLSYANVSTIILDFICIVKWFWKLVFEWESLTFIYYATFSYFIVSLLVTIMTDSILYVQVCSTPWACLSGPGWRLQLWHCRQCQSSRRLSCWNCK